MNDNTGGTNWKAVREQLKRDGLVYITGADNCRAALNAIDTVMRNGTKTGDVK